MSSTHPQSPHGPILNHDTSMMPNSITPVIGQSTFMPDANLEPKITLLSRPQLSMSGSTTGLVPPRTLESFPATGFTGRAARGDYFDTEDPSVNLHDFIINSMQSQKNRVVLIKLEEEFVSYVHDVNRNEPLKLPPWDSYHRMLAHRVAAYFGLEHNVDPMDKMCVIVHKGPNTRFPQRRFGDCMAKVLDEPESSEPKHILKRKEVAELETILGSSSDLSGLKSFKSFEEREEEYERARARIFSQQSPLETKEPSVVFDLETPSALTRRKSRLRRNACHSKCPVNDRWQFLPAIMQHRRAASDTTAFLFKGGLADLLNEGPAGDHSSPSITPMLSHLNKSTDAISHTVVSCQDFEQSPAKQLSPHPPKKLSQHNADLHSPPKLSKSLSDYQPSPAYEPSGPTDLSSGAAPFQSLQSGVPVVYQQQGAMIADPNWYPYQQMMVYQMPQGYIPAPQYSPFGQTIFQPGQLYAVNPPYPSMAAGGVPPGTVLAPGKDIHTPSQGAVVRPRGGYDHFSSPTHPAGLALVRPIPQQAAPIRVAAKAVGPWGSPIHQPYAIHQPVVVQPHGDQSAYTAIVPYPQDISTSQLADQVEASLHISESDGPTSSENFKSQPSESAITSHISRYSSSVAMMGSSSQVDGVYTFSNATAGGVTHNVLGGPMVSPTLPRGPVQFIPQQLPHPLYGGGPEGAFVSPGSQGSIIRYPAGFSPQSSSPGYHSTPGPLNFPPGVLQARPQGVFSPSSSGLTHSPVQILGHTLGTSLFSPPPSTSSRPALFSHSFIGKGDGPCHPPIGTGAIPENPGLMQSYNGASGNGSQSSPLPPRLSMQGRSQKGGANRYQNQRHPANRSSKLGSQEIHVGGGGSSEQMSSSSISGKKEALLPTPPSHHIVKLDTNLTCGVPLNVMELLSFPPDGSSEMVQVMQVLKDMGVTETKTGVMPKNGERIMVAIFEDSDRAMNALQIKHAKFVLSIPGNNHAKFILSLL